MVLQEEEVPSQEACQAQSLTAHPWGHAAMGDNLLGDLISNCQLDVCQGHDYPDNPQIASHQFYRFLTSLH